MLTGEAAVTMGAVGQGMVAGDLVNTASRLQSVAAPGTVLVGESTQRAAAASIVFEPAGEQVLKGRRRRCRPGWRCVSWLSVAGAGGRTPSSAPFVGRDEELRCSGPLQRHRAGAPHARLDHPAKAASQETPSLGVR